MNRIVAEWLAVRVPRAWEGRHWRRLCAAAEAGSPGAVAGVRRLVRRRARPPEHVAGELWSIVLARPDPDPELWRLVRGTGAEHAGYVRVLARLTADADHSPARLGEEWERRTAVDLAGRDDGHPATMLARAWLLRARDPAVLEELARLALDRPELAGWCAANDVVPADPATAAALFLLTGQLRRYRAIDPDAQWLAAAFDAAGPERRQRLLEAVAAADDLDVVAVARAGPGLEPEIWRMIWRIPVAEAVAAAGRLGIGWRPRDRQGRLLFEMLTADRRAASRPLLPEFRRRIRARVLDTALSPAGDRIAVLDNGFGAGSAGGRLYDLGPAGVQEYRYRFELSDRTHAVRAGYWPVALRALAHLGDAVIGLDAAGLCRHAAGRRRVLVAGDAFANVIRAGDGFVASRRDGRLYSGTADGVDRHTDAAVAELERGWTSVRDLRFSPGGHWLAAAPDRQYIVMALRQVLVVLDELGNPLTTRVLRPGDDRDIGLHGVAFVAPDAFVTLERTRGPDGRLAGILTRWRIDGAALVQEARLVTDGYRNLDAIDDAGLLVMAHERGRGIDVRDGRTLAPHDLPGLADLAAEHYPRGAGGRLALVRQADYWDVEITVQQPQVYRLLGIPLGDVTLTELAGLERALDDGPADLPERALLETLRDCVRLRYADAIELAPGPAAPGETDISLGGPARESGAPEP